MSNIEDRRKIALDYFNSRMNCTQSVILAFKDVLNVSEESLIAISSGFGGGMGGLGKTCGAVTGAYMVLSMIEYNPNLENSIASKKSYSSVRRFNNLFVEKYGTDSCKELSSIFRSKHVTRRQGCVSCVEEAVRILGEMIDSVD
ncbi:MAG: C-GCAxxG-C-C family protein [Marinifilaceae bacterium]|jgi:C_GCAxxG_C_C family probable redox protein|nr:C-GCAxxG-C-C family protein [Marinifilaceae bacterium]